MWVGDGGVAATMSVVALSVAVIVAVMLRSVKLILTLKQGRAITPPHYYCKSSVSTGWRENKKIKRTFLAQILIDCHAHRRFKSLIPTWLCHFYVAWQQGKSFYIIITLHVMKLSFLCIYV